MATCSECSQLQREMKTRPRPPLPGAGLEAKFEGASLCWLRLALAQHHRHSFLLASPAQHIHLDGLSNLPGWEGGFQKSH